ncbi:Ppx/GppA phosphatase [Sodiomyces alkalinus F11]|uniref:Ppx/GppA phosphatase n=1 Tax=Sodiomyces alkalinus (strain CBS 110278 / VKM F-3762 / F11) TaxID=1314773 RepID=A0A3N2PZ20_SODAK|nr:Ppx/GppA phosphatase [Sodiomyces alkalinus F11]ROT39747.1 Ppx/GppA phosphatase [Sodiomyces alkalinus F11]
MANRSDIITIDNLDARLPPWDPVGPSHLFALVDMGSNGIRFSISDLAPSQARLLRCIYRERAAISLFDALGSSCSSDSDTSDGLGHQPLSFPPETIVQVSQTVARFRRIADSYDVPLAHFSVLATEAMRRASNAAVMLDAIRAAAGVGVHVLAPEVETLFGAVMGSRSTLVDISRGGLFLDLGGGSVQMTWVDTRLPAYEVAAATAGESMPFGAARLIKVLEGSSAKVRTMETTKLRTSMRAAFSKICDKFPALSHSIETMKASRVEAEGHRQGIDVYLCGGGFRGYGCMLMHNDPIQPYPIPSVGTYTVSGEYFKQVDRMRRFNAEHDGKIYGMSSRRRQQFPAIAEVVEALIDTVPWIRTVTFCAGSNRDGALYMKLPKHIRESNPLEVLAGINPSDMPVAQAILQTLFNAVPVDVDLSKTPTIFSLGLGLLFARQIWVHQGEDDGANASYALHEAVTRDPSAPGLTHLARAVLGLTVCARWGANLGAIDAQLYRNLRGLLEGVDSDAGFWADYLGAVSGIIVDVLPAWPRSEDIVPHILKFEAALDETKKGRDRINLTVRVSPQAVQGLDTESLLGRLVKLLKRNKTSEKRVKVRIEEMSH